MTCAPLLPATAERVTVQPRDMKLARALRREPWDESYAAIG